MRRAWAAALALVLVYTAAGTGTATSSDAYFLSPQYATDSAAAATAISTGHKTDAGNIAWLPGDPAGGDLTTIAEWMRDSEGFAIGVATTVQFSHATPAAFVSHSVNRNKYSEIAQEIVSTVQPEVVIGGGDPLYNGGDYQYVGGESLWDALNLGSTAYTRVVTRASGVDGGEALRAAAADVVLSRGERLAGVFGGSGNNFDFHIAADTPGHPAISQGSIENPTLADAVIASLTVLDQDDDGFFVMFEQGDIDWSNHANDFASMVGGVWDLDQAANAAVSFVEAGDNGRIGWTNTLIIVTADHSNSYMRLPKALGRGDLPTQVKTLGAYLYPDGEVTYRTTGHTNELVTVWARGRAAYLFDDYVGTSASDTVWYPGEQSRIIDNSQLHDVMRRAVTEGDVKHLILFIGDGMNVEHEIAASRYLTGQDLGLVWHRWAELDDGWAGFCTTWDVTTYDHYAADLGVANYSTTAFNPSVGYDPRRGGWAPYPLDIGRLENSVYLPVLLR